MSGENSEIVRLVNNMELLYENIYNLVRAFQLASQSNSSSDIEVTLRHLDRTTETVVVNSFQTMMSEINRISNNFSAIVNQNNIAYILNGDGSLSSYVRTSFVNAEYINFENLTVADICNVDTNTLLADFLHPMVKVPITLGDDISLKTKIICHAYNISEGYDIIDNNITYTDFNNKVRNGEIVVETSITRELEPEKEQVKFFGKFSVLEINTVGTHLYSVKLNRIFYTGLNVNGNSLPLRVGDELVTVSGMLKFRIESVSEVTSTVVMRLIAGADSTEVLSVGTDNLMYNEIITTDHYVVGIPVKPRQNLVIFLSTENNSVVSYPSNGLKLNTVDYVVSYANDTYTIDEFFSRFVTNVSEYLMAVASENQIPNSMGIVPRTPELVQSNFKVIQINKHINNASSIADINKYNIDKQAILNRIDEKNKSVLTIKNELNKNLYSTIKEKQDKQSEIDALQADINTLENELLVISRRIDSDANRGSLKTFKAKYKIVGYWEIQNDLYSPSTGLQHIVKYEVQYRYLNNNSDDVNTTTMKMLDNGREVSVVFSPWNNLETSTLQKVKNIEGKSVWSTTSNTNADDLNINQCMISINENESVEIRIRAISEAGYPLNPVKSAWSNIVRVNFPEDLKVNNINDVILKNEVDLRNAEFTKILSDRGIISHIDDQLTESEKVYHHRAEFITSGLYTDDMKNIPLNIAIQTIKNEIQELKNINNNIPVIEVVDKDNNVYSIQNNQELSLYFGSIPQKINKRDRDNFGKIYRDTIYLRIRNTNSIPIGIFSLNPQQVINTRYVDVPVQSDTLLQTSGQVLYFRDRDLSMLEVGSLYDDNRTESNLIPDAITTDNPQVYVLDNNNQLVDADMPSDTFFNGGGVCFSINYTSLSRDNYQDEFNRLKTYNSLLKETKQQKMVYNQVTDGYEYPREIIGFDDNDVYAIGPNTCGAFLYPIISKTLLVDGSSTISTLVISPNTEVLIPIVFEYRPIDARGYIDGKASNPTKTYSKKLGISMMVGFMPFNFDIECHFNLVSANEINVGRARLTPSLNTVSIDQNVISRRIDSEIPSTVRQSDNSVVIDDNRNFESDEIPRSTTLL